MSFRLYRQISAAPKKFVTLDPDLVINEIINKFQKVDEEQDFDIALEYKFKVFFKQITMAKGQEKQ